MTKHDIDIKNIPKEIYDICFNNKTEPPFSGKYNEWYEKGNYYCTICGNHLFSSKCKYDSGSGWPSFFDKDNEKSLNTTIDKSHGMIRTEISCKNCNAHLGHVFDDGPKPTGKRYCINSLALKFVSL